MNKNTKPLVGKTIKSINTKSINCWIVTFTDGTKTCLWAEIDGPVGLPQIWLGEYSGEDKLPKYKH
jgi:hypothetical protein